MSMSAQETDLEIEDDLAIGVFWAILLLLRIDFDT